MGANDYKRGSALTSMIAVIHPSGTADRAKVSARWWWGITPAWTVEAAATREETRASTATIVIDLESRKRIDRECGRRDVKWVRL